MPEARADDGCRLWFDEVGVGPAIVFVHEFGGEPASWDHQVAALAVDHRCIRYAARGFVPSEVPDSVDSYGQTCSTADLGAIVDHLRLDTVHLVGTSMGSFTSLDFTMRHPERVRSLTLVGNSSGPRDAIERERYLTGWVEAEIDVRHRLGGRGAVEILERDPAYASLRRRLPDVWAAYAARLAAQPVDGAIRILDTLHRHRRSLWDDAELLAVIECPVLLAHGDEDYFLVEDTNRFLEATLPSSRRVRFEATGHLVNVERPSEFNELLRAHIAGAGD